MRTYIEQAGSVSAWALGLRDVRAVHATLHVAGASRASRPDRAGRKPAAALQRRAGAESGGRSLGWRRALPLDAALGPDPVLGQGAEHRLSDDQRAGRDRALQAGVPRGLPRPALPDPGRRLLRVDAVRRGEAAVADRDE